MVQAKPFAEQICDLLGKERRAAIADWHAFELGIIDVLFACEKSHEGRMAISVCATSWKMHTPNLSHALRRKKGARQNDCRVDGCSLRP